MGGSCGGLRPSEVVHLTIPDPAEQAPLVARSVTPPSPSGRGGTTLLRQRAPRSCTVFVMTLPNEHTSEGGRDDRGVPYHAESTPYPVLKTQVLKKGEMRSWFAARVDASTRRARSRASRARPTWATYVYARYATDTTATLTHMLDDAESLSCRSRCWRPTHLVIFGKVCSSVRPRSR